MAIDEYTIKDGAIVPVSPSIGQPVQAHGGGAQPAEREAWGAWRKSLGRFHAIDFNREYIERFYGNDPDFEVVRLTPSQPE